MPAPKDFVVPVPTPYQPLALPDGARQLPLGSGYITALIGTGGMSNVYKIWNPQMETFRAVKLMKPDLAPEARQRFQTEIKIMAALDHPNIVKIHSVGEWNGLAFIEMEFVDGSTLAEHMERNGALPVPLCSALGVMIARALAYAHNVEYMLFGKPYRGVIHRDLKPSNVMIGKDGSVRLVDFGIARPVETSLLTMDGAVMGTMQYLAPEQVSGKNVGVAADIYALGAVLYECISGRKAFPQKNFSQLMSAKTGNIFIPLRFFRLKIPADLIKLMAACMVFDVKKRPQSAAAVLKALERIHAAATAQSAEEIIRAFARASADGKNVILLRKPHRVPVAAWFAAAGLVVLASLFYLPHKHVSLPFTRTFPHLSPPAGPVSAQQAIVRSERKALPVSRPAVVTPVQRTYLDEMKAKLGITDPVEILVKVANMGDYTGVLRIVDDCSPDVANGKAARLLRLRALYGLRKTADVARCLDAGAIDDGEYYLTKAKYLCGRGETGRSLAELEKGIGAPAQFLDAETVRREYHYYRALCLSQMFDQAPTDGNRKNALDSWFEVKNELRNFPVHAYYKKAVAEMQRIGERYVAGKG